MTLLDIKQNYDVVVVGGGINGCGIARDAAGRGLSVLLCEQGDIGGATSSASSKLIHGGLRYLEHYEFGLVRESLQERASLLKSAPHLVKPMRFVLPHHPSMRPSWMIRLGLFCYDAFAGQLFKSKTAEKSALDKSRHIDLTNHIAGKALANNLKGGYEYSDCWADDARLVITVAKDAAERGVDIVRNTKCVAANRNESHWKIRLEPSYTPNSVEVTAKVLINATGPWATQFIRDHIKSQLSPTKDNIRTVQGSHIVVDKLFDHGYAYLLQNDDKRIVFAIPFLQQFTLIGTTDRDYEGDLNDVKISRQETSYLIELANKYFNQQIGSEDIVWNYAGVRPLYDDGSSTAQEATRGYIIKIDSEKSTAPLINIYGGKLTTFRYLAEEVVNELAPFFPSMGPAWTKTCILPGGNLPEASAATNPLDEFKNDLYQQFPNLPPKLLDRMAEAYGTRIFGLLDNISETKQLGELFGSNLYQVEVNYLIDSEWAKNAEDILWRRTKLGLSFFQPEVDKLQNYIKQRLTENKTHR